MFVLLLKSHIYPWYQYFVSLYIHKQVYILYISVYVGMYVYVYVYIMFFLCLLFSNPFFFSWKENGFNFDSLTNPIIFPHYGKCSLYGPKDLLLFLSKIFVFVAFMFRHMWSIVIMQFCDLWVIGQGLLFLWWYTVFQASLIENSVSVELS